MTSGEKGILLEPGEGKSLSVLSDTYTEKVVGRDTNGAFTLMELTLRGEAPPKHIHDAHEESFYVLEGVFGYFRFFKPEASIGYSIDIYRGKCKPTGDLLHFLAYVSMFPQLVAGPIVRYDFIEGQLRNLGRQKASLDRISDGVWLFVIGMVKKIWIADALAPVVALAFDGESSPAFFTAWAGTVGGRR